MDFCQIRNFPCGYTLNFYKLKNLGLMFNCTKIPPFSLIYLRKKLCCQFSLQDTIYL